MTCPYCDDPWPCNREPCRQRAREDEVSWREEHEERRGDRRYRLSLYEWREQ